ncbi:50S ribosomal protein L32 [Candidatus Jorgensenbacteria bacterium]|nr:50S ribosomal protein L32 [Candidatus Jorgensenbacteria bacterium]
MGGVPVKHHSKSKVGRRRSQLALKKIGPLVCLNCKGPTLPHKICPQCGLYSKSPSLKKT